MRLNFHIRKELYMLKRNRLPEWSRVFMQKRWRYGVILQRKYGVREHRLFLFSKKVWSFGSRECVYEVYFKGERSWVR